MRGGCDSISNCSPDLCCVLDYWVGGPGRGGGVAGTESSAASTAIRGEEGGHNALDIWDKPVPYMVRSKKTLDWDTEYLHM